MNPGDLRRFKDDAFFPAAASETFLGRTFMVVSIFKRVPGRTAGQVELLVDGKLVGPWGYPWVEQNSELLEPVHPNQRVVY